MNHRIFTFWVGEQIYGMPLLLVGEFCPLMDVTPVEVGDSRIPSVAHVRGTTAVVLDMRNVLGSKSKPVDPSKQDRVFILPQEQICDEGKQKQLRSFVEPVVLEIDRLGNIMDVDMADLHPTPAHLSADYYQGVFETDCGDLILLEFSTLIECLISELAKADS